MEQDLRRRIEELERENEDMRRVLLAIRTLTDLPSLRRGPGTSRSPLHARSS